MASEPIFAALDARVVQPRRAARVLSDYWALTKPEINFIIAITTAAGFWLGSPETVSQLPWAALVHTLFGTVLVASGAATLNQVIELRFDALMKRTARRPVASGRMQCSHALWFGMALSILGVAYLEVTTNSL